MQHSVCILRLICAAAVTFATAGSALAYENPVSARANTWTHGQPIPADLLAFHESHGDFAAQTETNVVFYGITNYDLLRTIILEPCDRRIFDCAVERALLLVGPVRFFHDMREVYAATPQLLSRPRHRTLQARSTRLHVLVDGLFIDDHDMPRDEVDGVFASIAADLRAGVTFAAVLQKYSNAYVYAYTQTLSDSSNVTLHRTRVGNYGDFIISERTHTALPFRFASIPEQHVRPLLRGRIGDIIVLRDESEHRNILYCIRDAYSPPAPRLKRPNQSLPRTAA